MADKRYQSGALKRKLKNERQQRKKEVISKMKRITGFYTPMTPQLDVQAENPETATEQCPTTDSLFTDPARWGKIDESVRAYWARKGPESAQNKDANVKASERHYKHQRRRKHLNVNDIEESEELPSLDKPGWYSQGNWPHLHELLKTMTGKPEPKVVFFGDSIRSDMFPASSFGKWETVMIVEEMEGEGVPKSDAAKSNEAQVEPLEKKGKFEEQGMKSPSAVSNQWGSYFVDVQKSAAGDEDIHKLTWCCHCIHKYSTMAIPSVEHIADLPLDYKFPRFSPDKPCTTGYYPRPPDSLLKRCESQ